MACFLVQCRLSKWVHKTKLTQSADCMTLTSNRRLLHSSAAQNVRFSGTKSKRRRPDNSIVLLDKFVKTVGNLSSVMFTAPFSLDLRASTFDANRRVDRKANAALLQDFHKYQGYHIEHVEGKEKKNNKEEPKKVSSDKMSNVDLMVEQISEKIFRLVHSEKQRESKSLKGPARLVPLHMLLYGRGLLRTDSYSILDDKHHNSHIYITDAASTEDVQTMLDTSGIYSGSKKSKSVSPNPSAWASVWNGNADRDEKGEVPLGSIWQSDEKRKRKRSVFPNVSGFKFYCPNHVINAYQNGIKALLLVPTILDMIYLKTERDGSIDLDGRLIRDLRKLTLLSETGNIKIRDTKALDIRLRSECGDIYCDGLLDGIITAETFGSGEIQAKYIDGTHSLFATSAGDITISEECHSSGSQFVTTSGNIYVKNLVNNATILVREESSVTFNMVVGTVLCIVKKGHVNAKISHLENDSTIQVGEGDVTLTLPSSPDFGMKITSSSNSIPPKIVNSGELYLSENGTREVFERPSTLFDEDDEMDDLDFEEDSDDESDGARWKRRPMLEVTVTNGKVTVLVDEPQKAGAKKKNSNEEDFWL